MTSTDPTDQPEAPDRPPYPEPGWCGIDDPGHDHDGIWWNAAEELEAMVRPPSRRTRERELRRDERAWQAVLGLHPRR